MEDETVPASKFQQFEKVRAINARMGEDVAGQQGTVIWCDQPCFSRRTGKWAEWAYSVYFPVLDRCRSFLESKLESTGDFDAEDAHLGKRFEISFDLVPLDDMTIVEGKYCLNLPGREFWVPIEDYNRMEGSYRIPGQFWQVYDFHKSDVPELRHHFEVWESGITDLAFDVPNEVVLYRDYLIRAMSLVFDTEPESWTVVRGPDSMLLR
jgi:hypothetical protein